MCHDVVIIGRLKWRRNRGFRRFSEPGPQASGAPEQDDTKRQEIIRLITYKLTIKCANVAIFRSRRSHLKTRFCVKVKWRWKGVSVCVAGCRWSCPGWTLIRASQCLDTFNAAAIPRPSTASWSANQSISNSHSRDQSNSASPSNSFVFTRWQHGTDGLAAICNCICLAEGSIAKSPLPLGGHWPPCVTMCHWNPQVYLQTVT